MVVYTFKPIKILAGTIQIVLTTDYGEGTTSETVNDDYVLNFGTHRKSLEESGGGGLKPFDDFEIEIYDRNQLFKDHIFCFSGANTVTSINAQITINDYTFNGEVDISSISRKIIYPDSESTYRFLVVDILRKLEEYTISDFCDEIEAVLESDSPSREISKDAWLLQQDMIYHRKHLCGAPDHYLSYVKVQQILLRIVQKVHPHVTRVDASQVQTRFANSAGTLRFDNIWYLWSSWEYILFPQVGHLSLFDKNQPAGYFSLGNLKELFNAIVDDFLLIPIIRDDTLVLKRRKGASYLQPEPVNRISADETPFIGYMACRVKIANPKYNYSGFTDGNEHINGTARTDLYYPSALLPSNNTNVNAPPVVDDKTVSDNFMLVRARRDYQSFVRLSSKNLMGAFAIWFEYGSTGMIPVPTIYENEFNGGDDMPYPNLYQRYTMYHEWLRDAHAKYWCNNIDGIDGDPKLSFPNMLERVYVGLSLNIELGDMMQIDSKLYTITELEYNLLENTTKIKMVNY